VFLMEKLMKTPSIVWFLCSLLEFRVKNTQFLREMGKRGEHSFEVAHWSAMQTNWLQTNVVRRLINCRLSPPHQICEVMAPFAANICSPTLMGSTLVGSFLLCRQILD
jgi:hypothetical protein